MTLSSPHGHHVTEGGSEITQQIRRDNTVEVRQQRIRGHFMPSQICDLISKTMALLGKCSIGEQHPRPLRDFKASTKIRFSFFLSLQ